MQYNFCVAKLTTPKEEDEAEEPSANQLALMARGLSQRVAAKLDRAHGERILEKIDIFEQLKKAKSPLIARNPTGWLRKAIEDDYKAVPGYRSPEQRHEKATRQQGLQEAQERVQQQEQIAKDALWARYESLPPGERAALKDQAMQQMRFLPQSKKQDLNENDPLLRAMLLSVLQQTQAQPV